MAMRFLGTTFVLAGCLLLGSCVHRQTPVAAAKSTATNQSFYDVAAGTRIRVVWPILKEGGTNPATVGGEAASPGATITLSAANLLGVRTAHYVARGRNSVRLELTSAEATRDGKTVAETGTPTLPFRLPTRAAHIRLVYLIRASAADHNMAMISAKKRDALEDFTGKFLADPNLCREDAAVSCVWVPAGVAVRPES